MRVAVMGTGGTGGYFGGLLARGGEDVTFIARGTHLAALRTTGLTITSRLAGNFTVAAQATDNPDAIGPVDLVLFCVKTYDTATAAELIRPLVAPHTVVLPFQNGVDAAERIGAVVGQDRVMGAVAFVTSGVVAPGTVAQTAGPGRVVLGERAGGPSARADQILRTLLRSGITAEVHPAIETALWEKFLFICAFSGITALTRLPLGSILESGPCRVLFRDVMDEVATLGRARGVALADDSVARGLALGESFEPWARGSLYHDLAAGRRLELETLHGTVVRLGRAHGVATPTNAVIYAALHPSIDGAPVPA